MSELLNELELDNREHDLVASLVIAFARSVEKETKYAPDSISNPIMFDLAAGILRKMEVDFAKDKSND